MKTEGQVRHQLQQVTYRHLKRNVRTALSRRPENCVHNGCLKLPGGPTRFCTLREGADGEFLPCDPAYGGVDQAAKCPEYQCANTKEKVRDDFRLFIQTSTLPTIAAEYPDIAALLWALESPPESVTLDETPEPETPLPSLPSPSYVIVKVEEGGEPPTFFPLPRVPVLRYPAFAYDPVTLKRL